jgi:hypothetical protein
MFPSRRFLLNVFAKSPLAAPPLITQVKIDLSEVKDPWLINIFACHKVKKVLFLRFSLFKDLDFNGLA